MSDIDDPHYRLRHSLAHVCAQAVQQLYPDAKLGFGPPTEDGFFYDFDFGTTKIEESDLKQIQKNMKKIISQGQDFDLIHLNYEEALARTTKAKQPYKVEQVELLHAKGVDTFSFYTNGPFDDLCEGPHVTNTRELPVDAFQINTLAGAYWLGDEKNKMLTRIYVFAFGDKQTLQEHLERRRLAQERDHKKLGKELGIYMISDMVGKGLPLWLPNGTIIRDTIETFAKEKEFQYGYHRVSTPHITKSDLYYRSQHLPAYRESMFPPMVVEEQHENGENRVKEEYYLKPMNCPHHHMIYANQPLSYRQLPYRLAEYGTCYRFEQSGELSGLLRVRSLCMNDAHIYLAEEQLAEEFTLIMKMYQEFYETFGLKNYTYRLSIRGEENKDKFKGDDAMWTRGEKILREVLESLEIPFYVGVGEAAFYGPKIDIQFKNLLGREETVSTIQVDYLSPENFDLWYTGADGREHRPVIVHRAPLSTHERFISFLIEYYGGAFPTWCSPVQVAIITTRDEILDYAEEIAGLLKSSFIRVDVDHSNNGLNKKIRNHVINKTPNMLILGDREMEERSVTLRRYGSREQQTLSLDAFLDLMVQKIKNRDFDTTSS